LDAALIICRLLHFAAAMLLFGASVFLSVLAPPIVAGALGRPLRQVAAGASLVAAITAVGWFMLEAGQIGEGWPDVISPHTLFAVLFGTDFGRVWLWRMGLAVLVAALMMLGRPNSWRMVGVLAALLLASLGLTQLAQLAAAFEFFRESP
jgi:putative copper resistance protein D